MFHGLRGIGYDGCFVGLVEMSFADILRVLCGLIFLTVSLSGISRVCGWYMDRHDPTFFDTCIVLFCLIVGAFLFVGTVVFILRHLEFIR